MEKIGKYEVVDKLGAGGFGVVYEAFDPFLKRRVAIKTCESTDSELRERFRREAEICGRLDHPNVVRVFDSGIDDDRLYLVQEFLAGQNLDARCRRGEPLAYPEKMLILLQVARGLEYAHSRGIVHRDVKPANVQILPDGTAKITDFGVATLAEGGDRLTRTGMTVGTVAYLSPEQIRGEPVDARSDIFSFGVLAYELLTGAPPFQGKNISAVFFRILNEEPRPIAPETSACPGELAAVVHRCLAKRAERRYADCRRLLEDLEAIRRPGSPARRQPAPGARRPAARTPSGLLDLALDPSAPRPPESGVQSVRRGGGRLRLLLDLAALAVLLVGAGSWWHRGHPETLAGLLGSPLLQRIDSRLGPSEPATAPGEEATTASSPAEPTAAVASAPPPAAPPEESPPPAPEPPPPARLEIAAGWSPSLRLSIDGGPPLPIGRSLARELAPGPHRLDFQLSLPGYQAARSVRIELAAGETRRVACPIPRPARITVQPHLGSPQGVVRLNGRILDRAADGPHVVAPGGHRLAVAALSRPDLDLVGLEVEVASGEEAVVTYDLTGRTAPVVHRRPPAGA